jgi:pyruvate/2-oxoglutarate dehydrogenase complex dihydrolipoamide acyltransferase (E2) component
VQPEKPNVEISTWASENSHVALAHNNITNISIIYINTKYRGDIYCIIKECDKRGSPQIAKKAKLNRNNSTKRGSRDTKV